MIDKLTEDACVELVQAAVRNRYVREYHNSKEWYAPCWSTENIVKHPPLRVQFEHATVYGTISEAIDISKSKTTWGKLLGIEPLGPEDVLDPLRIVYTLKASSKVRMRWEFRDTFKSILGKNRKLVNDAVHRTKKDFLAFVKEDDRKAIDYALHISPAEFWVYCRYGERFGPEGIHAFAQLLEERTRGYRLPFDVPLEALK